MKRRVIIAGLCLISGVTFAEPKLEGTPVELEKYLGGLDKTVMIQGTAETRSSSNKAIIHIVVETESVTLEKALQDNSLIRLRVRAQLKKAGISEENVRGSRFSSTPEYGFFGDEPKSYKVKNSLAIVVMSEEQMIKVASISDKEKNVRYISSKADVGDRLVIRAKLLRDALKSVKTKADIYQDQLGLKLTPISFSEQWHDAVDLELEPRRYKSNISSVAYRSGKQASFGEAKFVMSVSVKYKLSVK